VKYGNGLIQRRYGAIAVKVYLGYFVDFMRFFAFDDALFSWLETQRID